MAYLHLPYKSTYIGSWFYKHQVVCSSLLEVELYKLIHRTSGGMTGVQCNQSLKLADKTHVYLPTFVIKNNQIYQVSISYMDPKSISRTFEQIHSESIVSVNCAGFRSADSWVTHETWICTYHEVSWASMVEKCSSYEVLYTSIMNPFDYDSKIVVDTSWPPKYGPNKLIKKTYITTSLPWL